MFNRREFHRIALTGAAGLAIGPRARAEAWKPKLPAIKTTFRGVPVGCNTYSMTSLTLDEAIQAMLKVGCDEAELHPRHMEGSVQQDREKWRTWRMTTPLEVFEAAGKKFRDAGIFLYAYNINFRLDSADAELDKGFEMTKALGATIMSAVCPTNEVFRRLDPFAKKHQVRVGIHNEQGIRTPADYDAVRKGLSEYSAINLDIGHFWGAGSDPVDFLKNHRDDVILVHIKDRRRGGGTFPLGEGDTPIKEVLHVLRDGKYGIPANIEYENRNMDRTEGLRQSIEYCKNALQS